MGTVCKSAHVRLSRNYVTKKVTVNKKASIQGVVVLWADCKDINIRSGAIVTYMC